MFVLMQFSAVQFFHIHHDHCRNLSDIHLAPVAWRTEVQFVSSTVITYQTQTSNLRSAIIVSFVNVVMCSIYYKYTYVCTYIRRSVNIVHK